MSNSRELKTDVQPKSYTPVFIAPLFSIGKEGKQRKCPKLMNGYTKGGTFMQWNITQP